MEIVSPVPQNVVEAGDFVAGVSPESNWRSGSRSSAQVQWAELIEASASLSTRGLKPQPQYEGEGETQATVFPSERTERWSWSRWASCPEGGRVALEGAQIKPGDDATYQALTDATRRPPVPRAPLSQSIVEAHPEEEFKLDEDWFVQHVRCARRGAAAGPAGMLADHLQPMLDTARDTSLLFQFASVLACGHALPTVVEAIKMVRITALKKPTGGVHGIIVGDVFRRLVARTMAKQMAVRVEAATAPFQYALTTKAGCECVAHILQSMTDQDERATIVSIDGVGAYDLISRNAMREGLAAVLGGDRLLPFVRHFCGSPSTYMWEDGSGKTHMIPQGEG